MIKVNLLQNQSEAIEGATEFDIQDDLGGGGDQKELIAKIVLMMIPAIALMFWENHHINNLKDKMRVLSSENSKLTTELKKNQKIAKEAKKKQKEVLELEAKIAIIKDLSKVRLRELKALDALQNIIPERVWLNTLTYTDGNINIEGAALSDESLGEFVDGLEKRAYFTNVILLKAVEQKSKLGAIKVFTINTALGNVD